MAFSTNGNGGGGVGRRRGGASLAEINITPFVDVVLVLLIIFMLTAHVMEFGLQVDVPKVRQVKDTAQEMPVVSLTKEGTTYLNETATNINDLGAAIHQKFGTAKGVYVRADKETTWDILAQVVAMLGQDGFQVNMVTQPVDMGAKGRK
ncbi:MAG TPA: biopolymer transporter ExbD [Bryobacteraceae bacterium]|nr:biopolymer transporter ExbD [Bryobacteraceae bacterium]